MNVSFAPLRPDAVDYLTTQVGIDYSYGAPFIEPRWLCVTARDDDGMVMGVILCEFVNWFEAHFNVACADPRCVTRRLMRSTFTALFSKAVRLTAFIDIDNGRAIKNAVRMGFVHEGYCRLGINGNRDAYTFGMLREDCRFLPIHTTNRLMEPRHGQGRTVTT